MGPGPLRVPRVDEQRFAGLLRSQRTEDRDVGRDHPVGAVAVALDDHLQVLVAEQVGDLAQGDVSVDHQ